MRESGGKKRSSFCKVADTGKEFLILKRKICEREGFSTQAILQRAEKRPSEEKHFTGGKLALHKSGVNSSPSFETEPCHARKERLLYL